MSIAGVQEEERTDLTKQESKLVRARSTRLLLSLIKPVKNRLLLGLLMVTLSTALRVSGPALIAYGIDKALPAAIKQDWIPLFGVVAIYLAAAILTALTMAFFIRYAQRTNQDVLLDLRQRIYRHTQRLSIEFHEKYTSGRVISRQSSDLDSIKELLDNGGNEMVAGVLGMIFTAIALLLLDVNSFLILLCSLLPLFFLTRWFQVRTKLMFRKTRVASARLIVHFVETMTGIRAVKAFRKEEANNETYAELTEDYRKVNAKVIQLFGIYDPGLVMIGNLTVGAVLWLGGLRALDGQLELGVLTAAILYARRFFDPMEEIAMFYNAYQSASSALEKISGVLEELPSVAPAENPQTLSQPHGHVSLKNVEFHYSNGKTVLPKFDLDIPAGQIVAMVGTTGAGKSTLAKLISRFYDPSAGSVALDGLDLRNLSDEELRSNVVMVTQEAYLFGGSVAENIALGKPDASELEIEQAAKAVGAHDFILDLPDGYNTDVNKRGGRVSAGQRQLISFARAFIANPTVLILDEATSSLDIPSER
ncbi:MAG: ABC transporter ATP-binding protein, partial [Micrococcales bacterium]